MFKGGFRVAVCMVFSCVYLFAFLFSLMNFVGGINGNGINELIIFLLAFGEIVLLELKAK